MGISPLRCPSTSTIPSSMAANATTSSHTSISVTSSRISNAFHSRTTWSVPAVMSCPAAVASSAVTPPTWAGTVRSTRLSQHTSSLPQRVPANSTPPRPNATQLTISGTPPPQKIALRDANTTSVSPTLCAPADLEACWTRQRERCWRPADTKLVSSSGQNLRQRSQPLCRCAVFMHSRLPCAQSQSRSLENSFSTSQINHRPEAEKSRAPTPRPTKPSPNSLTTAPPRLLQILTHCSPPMATRSPLGWRLMHRALSDESSWIANDLLVDGLCSTALPSRITTNLPPLVASKPYLASC
mmetsp:Transcript_9852/g.23471  ORF Transcript_9852/g.23471 Transcript_9852/m.23471 type:complete len:298 (-) Transcript_9852:955-1848(-)